MTTKERLDQTDERIASITILQEENARQIAETRELQAENAKQIAELARLAARSEVRLSKLEEQYNELKTESNTTLGEIKNLMARIDRWLERSSNGHQ